LIVNYLEERTPKGFTLKIVQKKLSFLVFDQKGSSVYSDRQSAQVVHRIPAVAFFGNDFSVKSRALGEYNLYKVSRGKIIIPYTVYGQDENRYLMIDTDEEIDIMPVKAVFHEQLITLVKEIDSGLKPDYIVIDNNVPENDLVVAKNRCPSAVIINIMEETQKIEVEENPEDKRRLADEFSDINLNMLSQNPVFLARIHLRNSAVARVKQLLLDFDLSSIDAGYILTFIRTMLKNSSDELSKIKNQLADLENDFAFYVSVVDKNLEEVQRRISTAENSQALSSYKTILAKARSVYDENGTDEKMDEIEQMIIDRREEISK